MKGTLFTSEYCPGGHYSLRDRCLYAFAHRVFIIRPGKLNLQFIIGGSYLNTLLRVAIKTIAGRSRSCQQFTRPVQCFVV